MKHLKLFEFYGNNSEEIEELVDQLDDDFIDDFFDRTYSVDISDAIYMVNIWNYVDDERYVEEFIQGMVDNDSFSNFDYLDEDEFRTYIKYELIGNEDSIPSNIKKYLNKRRKKVDVNSSYREVFDQTDISKEKLMELISDAGYENEFIEDHYKEQYKNYTAYDIFSELYGEKDLEDNNTAYQFIKYYVDDNEIMRAAKENEDSDYKREHVGNYIDTNIGIQEKLFEINPQKNVLLLFEVINASKASIGDEYDFQKMFMEESIRNLKEEYETDDLEEIDSEIAEKLKELNDKFGLDSDIQKEYDKYMWIIKSEMYNL